MDAANCNDAPRLSLPRVLEPFRRRIEATVQPALALTPRTAPGAVVGSRFGGVPLVPWGTAWPQSPRRPMAFVGQLNFTQLARMAGSAIPGLPTRGVLALFYDAEEQRWGFDPQDRDFFRLTYLEHEAQAVALMPPLCVRDAFTPHALSPALRPSLPSAGDAEQARFPPGFARYLSRSYGAFHEAQCHAHQVMGHARWLERDARFQAQLATHGVYCGDFLTGPGVPEPVAAPGEWRLLWQLASDEAVGFSWGRAGYLYVLIREADLKARRFGRAWLIVQCP